jgi:hypothetical protein
MDSLLDPLAPQDHIPLGITWVASWLFKLVAALFNPVPLHIIVLPNRQFTSRDLIEPCHLCPALSPIGQKLLNNLDQGISLVIGLALCSGHHQQGRG